MTESNSKLSRRHWVVGAGTVAGLAATAAVLPRGVKSQVDAAAPSSAAPDTSAGYRLTAHIKRYYQTAKT